MRIAKNVTYTGMKSAAICLTTTVGGGSGVGSGRFRWSLFHLLIIMAPLGDGRMFRRLSRRRRRRRRGDRCCCTDRRHGHCCYPVSNKNEGSRVDRFYGQMKMRMISQRRVVFRSDQDLPMPSIVVMFMVMAMSGCGCGWWIG